VIYFLTAIGLPPGGSYTIHIYTQKTHRTTQDKQYIEHKNFESNTKILEDPGRNLVASLRVPGGE
jgi:hypothetical protein